MNTPIILALIALVAFGNRQFMIKVAGANEVYSPSWMLIEAVPYVIVVIAMHFVQRHPFELSPRMSGLAAASGLCGAIGIYAMILAFRLGGQGSIIFPIAAVGVIVAIGLSIIIYSEPITATKLVGLGLGISSIIVLSR